MHAVTQINFRLATSEDEDNHINLLKTRLEETGRLNQISESQIDTTGREFFKQMVNRQDIAIILGEAPDKTCVATATIYFLPMIRRGKYIAYVEYVLVAPSYRGQGLGKKLMNYVELVSKEWGAQTMKLSTKKDNEKNHQFYEGLGFKFTDRFMKKDIDETTY